MQFNYVVPHFLPRNCPIRASHRPHLCRVTPLYFELPLEKPVLWRRSMCTNSSLVRFFICIYSKEAKLTNHKSTKVKTCLVSLSTSAFPNLFQIIFIIAEIKVDVSINATELDCSSIIRSNTRTPRD